MSALLPPINSKLEETDVYSVLGEPQDPNSDWAELRMIRLAGYDYLFISHRLNTKLVNCTQLNEFLLDLYPIMATNGERAKIFIYSNSESGKPEFSALDINYRNGKLREFHVSTIKNLRQKEFIRTIFEHSGMLVGTA